LHRLPQLQRYLEQNEATVGLRPAWLGWHALARLSGDALTLARVRDRLIERLVNEGYSAERDLPQFLRTAGHQDAERVHVIQSHFAQLHERAMSWCSECEGVRQSSGHYVDLIFAFGLARVGLPTRSRELLKSADAFLAAKRAAERDSADDTYEVHDYLVRAFRYRVEQALLGKPHAGPLPADWRDSLDSGLKESSGNYPRYLVDRMRQQSRILEPQERFDPYRDFTQKHIGELEKRLAGLPDIKDARQLNSTIQDLIRSGAGRSPNPDEMISILAEALILSPRAGESLTIELLARVELVLDRQMSGMDAAHVGKKARLLDRALFMAANYDRTDAVQRLWPRFVELLQRSQEMKSPPPEVNTLFGQCLRSLRKLGLRDDIGKMIEQADRLVRGGRSVEALKASAGKDWPITLTTLLHLAGGWLFFGWVDRAAEILDAARDLLYSPEDRDNRDGLFPQYYANLAVAYVTALGQAPADLALNRIEGLFRNMRPLRDTFTTTRYYARLHLNIIEAVVLALVSEDFAMGAGARKWMDDDEYLIRRRIHRDHRAMLAKA
jgi:cellulose synthase operon protein C